ncbi:MAG: TRAP transporter substrate-binding protein [Beijerinckiaceae bacterium]
MKSTLDRRQFVMGSAAAVAGAGLPLSAAAAAEQLKLATFVPPPHVIMAKVLTPWAEEVAKLSNKALTVRMFPSMQLGGKPPELYRQMIRGISDITFTLPGYTSGDFPVMALTELPGMANSGADGTRKLWANFDKMLSPQFKGAKVLMLWNSDSASFMSKSKPIRTLADVKGLKIRTPSAAQSAQLVALGATPIDMPANQIYNALDRGVVDAAMIPMSAALDFKLIEVAQHFTINAPLGRSNFLVAMNAGRYGKLPAELRKIIDDTTGLNLSLKGAQIYDERSNAAVEAVRKSRNLITLTDAQNKEWLEGFRKHINETVAAGDKAGHPATALAKAYGLI